MCGIVGCYSAHPLDDESRLVASRMTDSLMHRGPDDEGVLIDEFTFFGHRRLSIIDLSSDGHQPFVSDDGRLVMVFNGEIFNYIELRAELESLGVFCRTKTDTEVLLRMFQHYGVECLHKLNGMFAFSVYDRVTRKLFLARDRVGVKPLYYTSVGGKFFFASEIKALRRVPGVDLQINYQTVFDYLCFNRTDISQETFNLTIKRVPKGHYMLISPEGISTVKWWDPFDYVSEDPPSVGDADVLETIEDILVSAVKLRMRSDVPVGSCLSGGLDSSIILGIIDQHGLARADYKTFTVSYPESPLDETSYIGDLKNKYEFQNFKIFPSADTALDNFASFSRFMDEPSSSPTFYSQYEVMRLARQHGTTVLLDGQGGDEVFAGYQYFHGFYFSELLRRKSYAKLFVELVACGRRKQEREAYLTFLFQELPAWVRKKLLLRSIGYVTAEFFDRHIDDSLIFKEFFSSRTLNQSLAYHFKYKLEHLLRAEDRNSMAFSLEARVPYLDYRLIQYALSLPASFKIQRGENKLLQKRALGAYTVDSILNRRDKIGFGTPAQAWMATKRWVDLATDSYRLVCERMPGVFRKNIQLKYNLFDRWKVMQLAYWLENNRHAI